MNKKRIFPFGYRMTEGQIDLNVEEAEVIRFIFQKYSEGLSVPKLTERIQAFNVPYREGSRWNKNMVCRILDNKIYLGNGEYPPIIEKCLFDKVLSQRSVSGSVHCFSRGPIFCMIFCKAICNSLLFLFHANSYGLMVFVSHGFPTGRLFLFHAVFPQADRFFHTIFLQNDSSSTRFPRNDPSCFAQLSRRPPRFWRQTSSSLSKRPERTAWGRPSRPRCTVPVPARVGA